MCTRSGCGCDAIVMYGYCIAGASTKPRPITPRVSLGVPAPPARPGTGSGLSLALNATPQLRPGTGLGHSPGPSGGSGPPTTPRSIMSSTSPGVYDACLHTRVTRLGSPASDLVATHRCILAGVVRSGVRRAGKLGGATGSKLRRESKVGSAATHVRERVHGLEDDTTCS